MALIQLDHKPITTKVNTPVRVILPDFFSDEIPDLQSCQVLFLLHGLSDDASAWQRYTNIESLVRYKPVMVVMPSVGRSFYTDMDNGQAYYTYLTQELPRYLETVFRVDLSEKKLLIAGISMGGFGAFKIALLNPERFRAALSLSGVLSLQVFSPANLTPEQESDRHEFDLVFGGLDKLAGSENDPAVWIKKAALDPSRIPELAMACGKQDSLLPANRWFFNEALNAQIPIRYRESDGGHDWLFWGEQIRIWLEEVL